LLKALVLVVRERNNFISRIEEADDSMGNLENRLNNKITSINVSGMMQKPQQRMNAGAKKIFKMSLLKSNEVDSGSWHARQR